MKRMIRSIIGCQLVGAIAICTHTPPVLTQLIGSSGSEGGYYLVGADGGVFSFGSATFFGSAAGMRLAAPVVGIASDLHNDGYWLVGSDGGVFSFGSAPFFGSAVGLVKTPVVGIATVAAGGYEGGYVVATADGTTVTFAPGTPPQIAPPPGGISGQVVGLSAPADLKGGVDLVTARGQVVPDGPIEANYGDASSVTLNAPIVGISMGGANGNHYQLVGADGGVFNYGTTFAGSMAGHRLSGPIVGEALQSDGAYYLAGRDGGVFAFGNAPFYGSAATEALNAPIVGIALG